MCGIAGIIDFAGRPVLQEELQRMTDAIAHRGPDGEGFFVDGAVGFGHRRLSIIDLSNAAAQPMTRFGLTITYNGEIYNYIELRKELEKQGIAFTTQSDTEVILAAYHCWGEDCVQRFNGMWAFAIYDATNREVFLSRDRFGEKPLYYTEQNGRFIFCSEIRGITKSNGFVPRMNRVSVAEFLIWEKAEHKAETFFEGILKVAAASSLKVDIAGKKRSLNIYYSPQPKNHLKQRSEQELQEELADLLKQSVLVRLRSDVQVGTCLSGGIDSSIIAAHMATIMLDTDDRKPISITAGLQDNKLDERAYAKLVANHCGLIGHKVVATPAQFTETLSRAIQVQEEPFVSASVLMQFFVMQQAKELGLKVLLDGQGADELFLGYKPHLIWALREMKFSSALFEAVKATDRYNMSATAMLSLLYHSTPKWKKRRQANRWPLLHKEIADKMSVSLNPDFELQKGCNERLFALQCNELADGSLPALLRYEDKNAMANCIETRLPYLDPAVVEFALNVPVNKKIQGGWSKFLLRKSANDLLPKSIVWRKGKIGFEAPGFPLSMPDNSDACQSLSSLLFKSEDAIHQLKNQRKDMLFRLNSTLHWMQQQGM